MINIKTFEFNPFGECTYLVWDCETLQAMVIDPGMLYEQERIEFSRFVSDNKLTIKHLVNTHMHLDHLWGDAYVAATYHLPIEANEADAMLAARVREQAQMFGMDPSALGPLQIDINLKQGDKVMLGKTTFEVLQVPGHSPGSIALYDAADAVVFTGDALFKGSIGRTDLPGGSYRTLIRSIKNQLLMLPAQTKVYPGHGEPTTIGAEKATNPYLR